MKELQGLLGETDRLIQHHDVKLSLPVNDLGVMYEVSDSVLPVPRGVGLVQQLRADYDSSQGIGLVVPPIVGLPEVLSETEGAASKVVSITQRYADAIRDISLLCQHHVINTFPHATRISHGGIFRIQITAKSAVYQILFPIGHGAYAIAYEGDIGDMIDGSALRKAPFSHIPPEIETYTANGYVSVTFDSWTELIRKTPHNAHKPRVPMYRSHTSEVFERVGAMVEELMAA